MPDTQSRSQRIAIFKRGLRSVPEGKLDPGAVNRKGSSLNLVAAGVAAVAEAVENRTMARLDELTQRSRGDAADRYVAERWWNEVVRQGADPSVVTVRVYRGAAGASGSVPAGKVITVGSTRYALDSSISVGASAIEAFGTATSIQAGAVTAVPADALTTWEDGPPSFDPALKVTNTEASAGGTDRMTDAAFHALARSYSKSVRRATLSALTACALQVAGVRKATAVEVRDDLGVCTGLVILYVADGRGQGNAALVSKVEEALLEYRAAGGPVRVVAGAPAYASVRVRLRYVAGYAADVVQELAREALVAAVAAQLPNAPLLRSTLIAALRTVPGALVYDDAIESPTTDATPPTAGDTWRLLAADVEFSS